MFAPIVAAVTLLASSVIAGPTASCMSKADATKVADNFKALINQPFSTSLAKSALTRNYHDYSDSVNELINNGCPNGPQALGSATFTSRAAFIKGQSGQAPIPWENLNIWNTCDTVIVRWVSSAPGTVTPEEQVTGIVVMETVANKDTSSDEPWLIQTGN